MNIEKKEVSLPGQRLSANLTKHLTEGHNHTINASNVFLDLDTEIGIVCKEHLRDQFLSYDITRRYTIKVLFDILKSSEGYVTAATNKPSADGQLFHWFFQLGKGKEKLFCVPSFSGLNDLLLLTEADKIKF
ncbi:hypothetical protein [Pedobacter sp. MR2016-24]|uniref:hypothetical protein n=1 Tax=Pedobacter sp. MR2016-24 TaxID=2994466 RepID=UPI002247BBFB|nr:hypothetical protein [Pedobacter sp. MR2016-24]MCX2482833.1 hypothetical protein [Pedobacter sp. MR2016-24]